MRGGDQFRRVLTSVLAIYYNLEIELISLNDIDPVDLDIFHSSSRNLRLCFDCYTNKEDLDSALSLAAKMREDYWRDFIFWERDLEKFSAEKINPSERRKEDRKNRREMRRLFNEPQEEEVELENNVSRSSSDSEDEDALSIEMESSDDECFDVRSVARDEERSGITEDDSIWYGPVNREPTLQGTQGAYDLQYEPKVPKS